MTPTEHKNAITKAIRTIGHGKHSQWQVFSDFVEVCAISISNAVDFPKYDIREARYLEIVGKYTKDEVDAFCKMFADLACALEEPDDVLGKIFHELELHNKYKGQFFTPYSLCYLMASMVHTDNFLTIIEKQGFVTMQEPACGSGAMAIALAEAVKERGQNPQQVMHVTATDIDLKCVHMAYVQLSLLNIPAYILHGNSLTMEEWDVWATPAHIMHGWAHKLYSRERIETTITPITISGNQMSLFEAL